MKGRVNSTQSQGHFKVKLQKSFLINLKLFCYLQVTQMAHFLQKASFNLHNCEKY